MGSFSVCLFVLSGFLRSTLYCEIHPGFVLGCCSLAQMFQWIGIGSSLRRLMGTWECKLATLTDDTAVGLGGCSCAGHAHRSGRCTPRRGFAGWPYLHPCWCCLPGNKRRSTWSLVLRKRPLLTGRRFSLVPQHESRHAHCSSSCSSFSILFIILSLFIWLQWVLVAAHGIFSVVACGIQFPNQGSNLGPRTGRTGS